MIFAGREYLSSMESSCRLCATKLEMFSFEYLLHSERYNRLVIVCEPCYQAWLARRAAALQKLDEEFSDLLP